MKFIKNSFIFLLVFLLSWAGMELYLSGAEIVSKSPNTYKDEYGRARKPNVKYLNFNEGFGMGQFNEYGYLGPGYPPEKPDGTLRIALLGDSYVEGFQVFDRHHFRCLLEKQLSERLNKKVEVMNFGRSGFNLADMYAYANLFASKFNPDIYLYFVSNEDLYSRQTDQLLPKLNVNPESVLTIHIPDNEKRIQVYKSQLTWMNKSTLAMLTRNCLTLLKNPDLTMKKLFDKLYISPLTDNHSFTEKPKIEPVNLAVLKNLHVSRDFIISTSKEETIIPGQYEPLVLLHLNEVLIKNGFYDQGFHYWKGSGKSGHWNQEAHQIIAKAITETIYSKDIHNSPTN